MEITWLGHSSFRLRGRDVVIVTDPYGGDDWDYPPLSVSADVVTVSHEHPHHATVQGVSGAPRVLRGPGEYEIGGAIIWGIRTPRRSAPEADTPEKNTAYAMQIEGLTVCHLGDLGGQLTAEQLTHIKDSDIVLVPVGGQCTIGAADAAKVVAQIEPKLIVPMHYSTPQSGDGLRLDGVERFCREMGAGDVTPQPKLTVTSSSLPDEPTVVLLEPRRP